MKYAVVLMDGASDYPIEKLGRKTPLQYAQKPFIDFLSARGEMGIVKTIPDGFSPGSDIANLSVMGYNPEKYYSGRSSLEAVSMGVDLSEEDVTFRCNLVTLSEGEGDFFDKVMVDYSSDEISSEEAKILIDYIAKRLGKKLKIPGFKFYPGVSYRHVIVWRNGPLALTLTPPHDIQGQKISPYLPRGEGESLITDIIRESYELLNSHPLNEKRRKKGLKPANSIWIWGEGRKPMLDSFYDKYGVRGSVIAAVDLIKGIGICAGLDSVRVKGVTGNLNTNFEGKARKALEELLRGKDFVYVHIEAPDECSHHGDLEGKIKAIELIDKKVVGILWKGLEKMVRNYRIMILPDHATPLSVRTHVSNPVPFLIYDSALDRCGSESLGSPESNTGAKDITNIKNMKSEVKKRVKSKIRDSKEEFFGCESGFNEVNARRSGIFIKEGYRLMDHFLGKNEIKY
ncbi:MAG: cofactor-independent phosphoglycerate mutase [Actinobacteria bacterium]|nr:cofactor-independent phosphoglycerate mutase [Actinomycetota bacterium]